MSIGKMFNCVLPDSARVYLYSCYRNYESFQEKCRRASMFERTMQKFINDPVQSVRSQNGVLSDLIYGWGNEQWSALEKYLSDCLKYALVADGPILECGSGLTTIMLGVIAEASGNTVWSLEHNPEWASRVEKSLKKYNISSVRVIVRPLKNFGEFTWYDPPLSDLPMRYSLVICDGPPASTPGGRYGLLPIMKERLKPGSIILLDDTDREQEKLIAVRWATELNGNFESCGTTNPYIIISVPRVEASCD